MPLDDMQIKISNVYNNQGIPYLLKKINKFLETGKATDLSAEVEFFEKNEQNDIPKNYWQVVCTITVKGRKDELSEDEDDELTHLLYIDVDGIESRSITYLLSDTEYELDDYEGILIKLAFS